LQNYVVGLSNGGLVLADDGSLDLKKSFICIDYFALMEQIRAQNNVQAGVSSKPVDFVAAAISAERVQAALPSDFQSIDDAVLLYADENRQALILGRRAEDGQLWLRYLP